MGDRRRSRHLTWAASLAAGLGLNALMLSLLVLVQRPRPVAQTPSLKLILVRPEIPFRIPRTRRPIAGSRSAPVAARPTREAAASPLPVQPSAAGGPSGPQAAIGPPGGAELGAVLRGAVGCTDPSGYRLSPQERERCLQRLGSGARQAAFIPAPIDPGKRAWFDATAAAYHSEGHLPAPVCKVFFSGPKTKFKPAHGLKIPGLPCYLIPPKGMLTDEADVAPPEHVETR